MALLKRFRPLKKIIHNSHKSLNKALDRQPLTRQETLREIKNNLNKGEIDPANLFTTDADERTFSSSKAIYKIGFVGLREEPVGFITVSFVPKGKKIYSPYVIFQQTYTDFLNFTKQDSLGKYWHKHYYKKTTYKQQNTEILSASEVIAFLDKVKTTSINDSTKIINKTLQKLVIESTAIEQLQQTKKSLTMPKELKKAISLAKRLI